jgi:3-phosphoshikimate 1-carboxyvinyltransferase
VVGRGRDPFAEPEDVLDAGNSGTTMRLLTGLLAAQPIFSVLTGDGSLRKRPMERVVDPLRKMGAEIWGRIGGRFPPLVIKGGSLIPIHYASTLASAQVKTAVLLAGLSLQGETSITEPYLSRDHTERMLRYMGASVRSEGDRIRLTGGRLLEAKDLSIPGDPSSAAFLIVGALITPDSELEIRHVCVNPTRIGYLRVLQRMGARIEWTDSREICGEPVADLRVKSSRLKGTVIRPAEVPACIDEIPVLCVAAACAEGTTRIAGAGELRVKESDRIAAMAANLSEMGIPVLEKPDGLEIEGKGRIQAFEGQSWDDHRIGMSLIIAAMAAEGPCRILGAACTRISFPDFLGHLAPLAQR